ncbi:unnamed protein product [Spirodela intermedia]|uniref:Inhibitor I9 domain-containing protein n=1 Tax=Spirodela intermedia TaxID=51605 RepID=A0A7I8KXT4_SPIIN|nr:unnamed protein product [Spirodela intermedia]
MEPKKPVPYFVFLNFDPEYERLRRDRSTQQELEAYITKKHDKLLSGALKLNTYRKRFSMAIVDGFAVEMTDKQAELLRSAGEVRVVEKNLELD